jgi:hypothetical protein
MACVTKPKIQQCLPNTYMFGEFNALYCIFTGLAWAWETALEIVSCIHERDYQSHLHSASLAS